VNAIGQIYGSADTSHWDSLSIFFYPAQRRFPLEQHTFHIAWHPTFVHALMLEMKQYKDVLDFSSAYQLNAEPLKIDLFIIKKAPELVIEKNIAQIFKQANILKYKSPEDSFLIWEFHKVISYTYLYAALNKNPSRKRRGIEDFPLKSLRMRGNKYPAPPVLTAPRGGVFNPKGIKDKSICPQTTPYMAMRTSTD
jgi:hypothetical protein